MIKEFFNVGKVWRCEGWVSFSFQDFGLGIITYNKKGIHNLQITIVFLDFYISIYKSRK